MSNLPNRSNYGFLSCLYSLLKSRFNNKVVNFNLDYLKYDSLKNKNTINFCTGAIKLDKILSKTLKRKKFCPFVEDRTSPHVCNLVYSIQSDSQKSKATGTAALLLEILDLVKIDYSLNGKIKNINWTKNAELVNKLDWNDDKLGSYFIEKILNYGPSVGFINFAQKKSSQKNGNFDRSDIREFMGFPSIDETIKGSEICIKESCLYKEEVFKFPTGTTSQDSKTRTMKSLFFLCAATGIILPKEIKINSKFKKSQYPFFIDNWYFNVWGKVDQYPNNWVFNQKIYKYYFEENYSLKIKKIVNYQNLIQQSSHRNNQNKCTECTKNFINLFYKSKGEIIKYRRYLLLKAICFANQTKKNLNIKKFFEITLKNNFFCLSEGNHYISLIKDLDLANLLGFCVTLDLEIVSSKANLENVDFGDVPAKLNSEVQKILSMNIYN
jgi:hypothetical protein